MIFYVDDTHPWPQSIGFVDQAPQSFLDWIIDKKGLKNSTLQKLKPGRPATWVFDLDSTLFCVSERLKRILGTYLRLHPSPPLRWHWLYKDLGPEEHRYSVRQTFEAHFKKLDHQKATEWSFELWQEFESFWKDAFFSNHFIRYDKAYAGAVDFVNKLYSLGFEIVYLTGRDRPRTFEGSYHALRQNGFPWSNSTHLYMKPTQEMTDVDFKEQTCLELQHRFDVWVSVDNEPENLTMFADKLKESEIVFFHSIMSPRVPTGKAYSLRLGERKAWRWQGYL